MATIYRSDKLIKIDIYPIKHQSNFTWHPIKKIFLGLISTGGYFKDRLGITKINNTLYFIKDDKVFNYPQLVLRFTDEVTHQLVFTEGEDKMNLTLNRLKSLFASSTLVSVDIHELTEKE